MRSIVFVFLFIGTVSYAQHRTVIALQPDEYWWGGAVQYSDKAPFGMSSAFSFDLYGDVSNNQSVPLLISNKGRWVWSETPFKYNFRNDSLILSSSNVDQISQGKAGNSLAEAYQYASSNFYKSSGKWIDSLLITSPQYNLWIELLNNPTQEKVMNYARKLLKEGYPTGVLMIDNRWEGYHGQFDFDKGLFPNPKQMMDSLHLLGFKVMLWVCPFVSPDSKAYSTLLDKKYFILDNHGDKKKGWNELYDPFIVSWWDGYSACLDLSNPDAKNWLQRKLDFLQTEYHVDGFKFDAGDPYFYNHPDVVSYKPSTPNDHCLYWAEVGIRYPLNEYRAMWKMGGQPLVQRLSDKGHSWKDLQALIPSTITQQLLGYTFTCPDMIGGGLSASFNESTKVDQNLFVRSAQCHALMPMMQFSAAPWRVLDKEHQEMTRQAVALRKQYMPVIMKAITASVQTGTPVLQSLEYAYPNQGYQQVNDQFIIGNLMVAPVVTSDNNRVVVFPKGKWKYKNRIIKGKTTESFNVPMNEVLSFEKLN